MSGKDLLLVHYMLIREMDEHSPIKLFNWTPENPEDALSKHTKERAEHSAIQRQIRQRKQQKKRKAGNKHGLY